MLDTGGLTRWVCSNRTDHDKSLHSLLLTIFHQPNRCILVNICGFFRTGMPSGTSGKNNGIQPAEKYFPTLPQISSNAGTPSAVNFVCCWASRLKQPEKSHERPTSFHSILSLLSHLPQQLIPSSFCSTTNCWDIARHSSFSWRLEDSTILSRTVSFIILSL